MGNEYLRCSEWARTSENFSQEERSGWICWIVSAPTVCSLDHLTKDAHTQELGLTTWPSLYLFTYALWIERKGWQGLQGKGSGPESIQYDLMTCEATGKHKNVGIFQLSTRPRRLIAPWNWSWKDWDGNFVIVNQFFCFLFYAISGQQKSTEVIKCDYRWWHLWLMARTFCSFQMGRDNTFDYKKTRRYIDDTRVIRKRKMNTGKCIFIWVRFACRKKG